MKLREVEADAEAIFSIALKTVQNGMEQDAKQTDADFLNADGLLMCGTCKTPKQMMIDVPYVGQRVVPIMCKCAQERRAQEEARNKAAEEQERINAMRRMGITNSLYAEMTFANDDGQDQRMSAIARRYVEKRSEMLKENIGLLLHGGVGGGKTFFAACIANAMIDNGYSALITTIPELISAMTKDYESEKAHILEKIRRVKFLVLDDVGFERTSSYGHEKIYEIINARYMAGKPLIVTTNLSLQEIENPSSMDYKRPFDRLLEMCQPIHVSGEGRRKAIGREKGQRAREILGL